MTDMQVDQRPIDESQKSVASWVFWFLGLILLRRALAGSENSGFTLSSETEEDEKADLEKALDAIVEQLKMCSSGMQAAQAEMQKVFVYSLALGSLGAAVAGKVAELGFTSEILTFSLLFMALVFFMLTLNYMSNMISIGHSSRYMRILGERYRRLAPEIKGHPGVKASHYDWELFIREAYRPMFPRLVLKMTWGTQPLVPMVFGLICVLIGFDISSLSPFALGSLDWKLLLIFVLATTMWLFSMFALLYALTLINSEIDLREADGAAWRRSSK